MKTTERKELLKAVLQGDKAAIERLTKGGNLYLGNGTSYYKNDLENPISQIQFDKEFRHGFDQLLICGDCPELQVKLLKEFGLSDNEIKEHLAKNVSFEDTANEVFKLQKRLQNE